MSYDTKIDVGLTVH